MIGDEIIQWLLEGDVSIQYQTHRDLLDSDRDDLRSRIEYEGWGSGFLQKMHPDGFWGQKYYQPKWISTHYTLLDLKNLGISPGCGGIRFALSQTLRVLKKSSDGGILPIGKYQKSDVCLNGMFLNFASYFGVSEEYLRSIVDFLLGQRMKDGGFNCHFNTVGAVHSSMHTTLSVLEGMNEYCRCGYGYRARELAEAEAAGREFLLHHRLFKSHSTGQVMDPKMLMLSWPSRWRYDILRALDYFRLARVPADPRMSDAIEVLQRKRRADGKWPLQARHPGKTHFEMEKTGAPGRSNTLRSLRVLHCLGKL